MNPSPEAAGEPAAQEFLDVPPATDTYIEIEDIAAIDTAVLPCVSQETTTPAAPAEETELELDGAEIIALLEPK